MSKTTTTRTSARTRRAPEESSPRTRHPAEEQDFERANNEGTELTLEERRELIRNEFVQEALPKAPEIPGYHMCWLSTTHSYDTIPRRLRLGYELVRKDELPGFHVSKTNSGEYGDYVMCNEMVLAKLPMDIYQMIMKEFHHDRPEREEEAIHQKLAEFDKQNDPKGRSSTVRDEAMQEEELVRRARVPEFTN